MVIPPWLKAVSTPIIGAETALCNTTVMPVSLLYGVQYYLMGLLGISSDLWCAFRYTQLLKHGNLVTSTQGCKSILLLTEILR